MEGGQVLSSLQALYGQEPEVAEAFLMAAVYCRAIASGRSPRDVVDALWKALPSATSWQPLQAALVASLEEATGGAPQD